MSKPGFIIFCVLSLSRLSGQSVEEVIQKTAIELKDKKAPNQHLYNALKNYKVICIGEMHGTKEPAEFLIGLAKTFVANKRSVVVGFEIPENVMIHFRQHPDSAGLSKTTFFSKNTVDGKASEAWFLAIQECNQLGLSLCFFDDEGDNRDFEMYRRLLSCFKGDTSVVLLTLSGNLHNQLIPSDNCKTMACYLNKHFGTKLCSINHIYNGGNMFNKTSEGLKIHTVTPSNNPFSKATHYQSYYLPNQFNITGYSGFFYTETVHASLPFRK